MAATTEAKRSVTIKAQPLTAEAFAPYGRVVKAEREALQMEEGKFTARLMTVRRVPERIDHINMHTDHSQMFVPLAGERLAAHQDEPRRQLRSVGPPARPLRRARRDVSVGARPRRRRRQRTRRPPRERRRATT